MSQCVLKELRGVRKLEGEKRTALTICVDILRIAIGGASKTKIVYWGNLNFKIAGKHLKTLGELGLIEQYDNSSFFITTKKGRGVVEYFFDLNQLLLSPKETLG